MALVDNGSKARMDLLNPEPEQDVAIEQTQPMIIAPNQENDSKSVETPKPDKGKIGCFTTAVIIISSFIVAGPLAFFSIEYFIESGNEFGLFVGIFFIVIGTVVAILLFKHQKSDSNTASSLSKPDSGLSLDATASAIMMGLWLGGKKDRDSESDSLRDTFLWQEKYHKDRY